MPASSSVTPIIPDVGVIYLRSVLREHHAHIRRSKRPQAIYYFDDAFHRVDALSKRGARWAREHELGLLGVYTKRVTLEQLVEDARVVLVECTA